jgi:hypothetical protein
MAAAGARGGAAGFLAGEVLLFALARRECLRAGFGFPLGAPLLRAGLAALPMGAVLLVWRGGALSSILLGMAVYGATLALGWKRLARRSGLPAWRAVPEARA